MERYRYQTLTADIAELGKPSLNDKLNHFGGEGWKVVATVVRERHGYTHEIHLLLMQAIES